MTHDSREALKPCPFCGGEAKIFSYRTSEDSEGVHIECIKCGVRTDATDDAYADRLTAVSMWNTRALTASPGEQEPPPAAGWDITDDMVERACKAYADATGYYVEFHRGLSSPSADGMRKGMRAALKALRREAPAPEGVAGEPTLAVRLEARPTNGSADWTEIFPAQLNWVVKAGHEVRAIEVPSRPDAGGGVREQLAEALAENKALRAANTQLVLAERDRIEAALSILPAGGGVRVKPLEWHDNRHAQSILGVYSINSWSSGAFSILRPNKSYPDNNSFPTVDAAKAAAQADYESRIFSALSTPPAAVESNYYAIQAALSPHIASSTELMAAMSSIWPLIKSPAAAESNTSVEARLREAAERREIVARLLRNARLVTSVDRLRVEIADVEGLALAILAALDGGAGA
jgi:Lar family restriction alleviation protein